MTRHDAGRDWTGRKGTGGVETKRDGRKKHGRTIKKCCCGHSLRFIKRGENNKDFMKVTRKLRDFRLKWDGNYKIRQDEVCFKKRGENYKDFMKVWQKLHDSRLKWGGNYKIRGSSKSDGMEITSLKTTWKWKRMKLQESGIEFTISPRKSLIWLTNVSRNNESFIYELWFFNLIRYWYK